jgi:acyl carrier protein
VDIEAELNSFLVDVLGVAVKHGPVPADAHLVNDLGVDSAGIFELILWIEDRLDCHIPAQDMILENFKSIAAVTRYIQAAMAARPAGQGRALQDAAE